MNRKAPTFLTLSAIVIGFLMILSNYYVPSADAPQISLTLHDADGVKIVSIGETAEYLIKVENNGNSRGFLSLSKEGIAEGWASTLSHTQLLIMPGTHQLVSLYVTPESGDAAPSIDVNVLATRGDNVTIVSTTTYLGGDVLIRKEGETQWENFTKDDGVDEGDDLKTELDSRVQVDFKKELSLSLFPTTEIHVTHSNELDGDSTYNILIRKGRIGISVNLPTRNSTFILKFDSGKNVLVNSTSEAVLIVDASGKVRVLKGTVYLNAPIDRQGGNGMLILTPGTDSEGNEFQYGMISFPNDMVTGILENIKGDTIGFDNSGNFVASGDLDGFLFRDSELDLDIFYVYGLDLESMSLELSRITSGTIDVIYSRFTPDLKGFVFENLDTPSKGTIFFRFKEDSVYLRSESELDYDLEIRFKETDRFYLNDMTLREGEGNSYSVVNFVHIENADVNSVLFGIDTDGDEKNDDEVMIHTDMTGEEVYNNLEEDEDASLWAVAGAALIIVLIIIGMYFFLRMGEQMDYDEGPEGPAGPDEAGSEGEDSKGQYEPFDLGEGELPDEKGSEIKDVGDDLDDEAPDDDLVSGPPAFLEMTDGAKDEQDDAPPQEPDDEVTFEEMEELRQPIGEHPPGSDDTQAETFGGGDLFTGEGPGTEEAPEPPGDDQERTIVEDLVDMKSDKILDEEYGPIHPEGSPAEPGTSDEIPFTESIGDEPQPESMSRDFAPSDMAGEETLPSDIPDEEPLPSDAIDEEPLPSDVMGEEPLTSDVKDEDPPIPEMTPDLEEPSMEREPISSDIPPGAESFAPPDGSDDLLRDEEVGSDVPIVPVVLPGVVPSEEPYEDGSEDPEEPPEHVPETLPVESPEEPEEEPYEEGDEIFTEIQENLFVVPGKAEHDRTEGSSADEGSDADQGGADEADEEPTDHLTRDQIQANLRQVQELKSEMTDIDTSSQDGEWWQDWHKDIKKDIDESIQMGKESAEEEGSDDPEPKDTPARSAEDEDDWIEKDPLFSEE